MPAFVELRREAQRDSPWAFAASEESDVGVNAELMRQRIAEPGQVISAHAEGAKRLYERLGFKQWGVEPAALMLDGVAYDEAHMWISLEDRRGVLSIPICPQSSPCS